MTYVPKPQRIVNRKLLDSYQGQPCAVLGPKSDVGGRESAYHWGKIDPHHIKTRGSGGDDVDENLANLCRWHHRCIHNDGIKTFIEKWHIDPSILKKLEAYLEVWGK